MPLYFAYGANMDVDAMAIMCPKSHNLGAARLARFRFFIAKSGYASVTPAPAKQVFGLLWDIAFSDWRALDKYENVSGGLYAKVQQVVITKSGPRRALIFIACSDESGNAAPQYLKQVMKAAEAAQLPPSYLQELSKFSSGVALKTNNTRAQTSL